MAVYFIAEEGTERVKIGTTRYPVWVRLKELQYIHPRQLILMRAIAGNEKQECAAHKTFAHLRLDGEWFAYSDDMWDFGKTIDIGARPVPKKTGSKPRPRLGFGDIESCIPG
jgi:hypothetical protein